MGVAQNFNNDILYTLDELSGASIEISADPREITDKRGNVVRRIYPAKTGTFSATNAFLHPQVMNAASGSSIQNASEDAPIRTPMMAIVNAGGTIDVSEAIADTIHVIGIFGNGANSVALVQSTAAAYDDEEPTYAVADNVLTVPAASTGAPVRYVVLYEYMLTSGMKLVNNTTDVPKTVQLTIKATYVDPCEEDLKACYIYIPSFMADPSVTISLDSETQEMEFTGALQTSYCGTDKLLYAIYFPENDVVTTGVVSA